MSVTIGRQGKFDRQVEGSGYTQSVYVPVVFEAQSFLSPLGCPCKRAHQLCTTSLCYSEQTTLPLWMQGPHRLVWKTEKLLMTWRFLCISDCISAKDFSLPPHNNSSLGQTLLSPAMHEVTAKFLASD